MVSRRLMGCPGVASSAEVERVFQGHTVGGYRAACEELGDSAGRCLAQRASEFLKVGGVRHEGPFTAVGQETLKQA